MAGPITNFNQQMLDRQMMMMDRMRTLCPQTAAIGERLSMRPVELWEAPTAPTQPGFTPFGSTDLQMRNDRAMMYADMKQAQNSQGLMGILGQACAQEMITGQVAVVPPFLQP